MSSVSAHLPSASSMEALATIESKRQRCWLVLVALVVFVLASLWVWCGGLSRIAVQRTARKAFLASRHGQPDSYSFVVRGVEYGMTPQQVDGLMAGAYEAGRRMPQESPPWDGFVNVYLFRYGPSWWNRMERREEYLYEEWYWVYFDSDERAVKMLRSMLSGGGHSWRERNVTIDLKDQRMTPR